jgi:hypothetical protein
MADHHQWRILNAFMLQFFIPVEIIRILQTYTVIKLNIFDMYNGICLIPFRRSTLNRGSSVFTLGEP